MPDDRQPQQQSEARPQSQAGTVGNGHSAQNGQQGDRPSNYENSGGPQTQGNQDTDGTASPSSDSGSPDAGAQKSKGLFQNPLFLIVAAVVLIAAVIWGVNFYNYSRTHVGTDDAYVTGDLINVSPVISGTLAQLNVEEGDVVKQGQIIARLDDSGPRAAFNQSRAAYKAALSQVPQAQTDLTYQQLSVQAQINQALAAVRAQAAKTQQSQQQVVLTQQDYLSQLEQARAQLAAAQAQAQTAQAQAANSQQAIRTDQAALAAAMQQVASARANAVKSDADASRYASLYQVQAVTAEQNDAQQAASKQADAQLASTAAQAAQARSLVSQARAQLSAALATARAARQQTAAAAATVRMASSSILNIGIQRSNVANNLQQVSQTQAQLQGAQAGTQQVLLRKQQMLTARVEADQAQAAMQNAQVTLDDTVIAAPSDGTIVKKAVNIGDALSPGQTVATMTRGNNVWITANYKETQLQGVKPGQLADVSVDALPGIVFQGRVQSINEASGNSMALLPADNATGNFTKVVQRIPVKIVLIAHDPGNPGRFATQADIDNLRQGMSCEPSIDLTSSSTGK